MYLPPHFHEQDEARMVGMMEQFSFATLVTSEQGLPVASHLPLLVRRGADRGLVLLGHMARANSQWKSFREPGEVLAIFQGPHGYVSPSWYVTAPSVPTWNYVAIHAYGHPRLIEEEAPVLQLLRDMAAKYESGRDNAWSVELAQEYVRRLLAGIVAFELRLTRLEGKFKLSQNRSEQDRRGVVAALEHGGAGERDLATLMREHAPDIK